MTIREKLESMLLDCGLAKQQAGPLVDSWISTYEDSDIMDGHWDDACEEYPPFMMSILWSGLKWRALQWVEEMSNKGQLATCTTLGLLVTRLKQKGGEIL